MIPEGFKEKMKDVLGEEYDAFINAIEGGNAVRGMRVNLLKTDVESFIKEAPFKLEAIPYVDNGFILREERQMGAEAYHHAGAVYMQDPGAMATLAAIDVEPDWWVLDMCAAPGGKSSQAAERLSDNGFLLSNEYVPKRAKITVGNFERLGIKNAIVTSLDTGELARMFTAAFDLVIADAPCSGEGMFRKSEEAVTDWSEDNVRLCAERQSEILSNAAELVKPGGYLLYSTCTYSPEENECVIADFLRKHGDYALAKPKGCVINVTRPGIKKYAEDIPNIEYARRFYPHVTEGEGQFLALMKREDNSGKKTTIHYKDEAKPLTKAEASVINAFFKDALIQAPSGRAVRVGDNPVLIPHECPVPKRSTFMSGVLLGEIKGSTFFPSHHFFSAYGELFRAKEYLTEGDPRAERYLRGEEIEASDGIKGWCAVFFMNSPLGGGKASNGRIKNHYPKGLRTRK